MTAKQYPQVYLHRRIAQAKLLIDANFAQEMDVHNIAYEAFYSKYHFIRLFKNAYGKTPHQYLTTVRIDKAKQMLQLEKPVSFNSIGFESLGSSSRLICHSTGSTQC
jgi:transcriptional regulator GlxA family with amidase domain